MRRSTQELLDGFAGPCPAPGEPTLCEYEGALVAIPPGLRPDTVDPLLQDYIDADGIVYPSLVLPQTLGPSTSAGPAAGGGDVVAEPYWSEPALGTYIVSVLTGRATVQADASSAMRLAAWLVRMADLAAWRETLYAHAWDLCLGRPLAWLSASMAVAPARLLRSAAPWLSSIPAAPPSSATAPSSGTAAAPSRGRWSRPAASSGSEAFATSPARSRSLSPMRSPTPPASRLARFVHRIMPRATPPIPATHLMPHGPVRCLAWHPCRQALAVAHSDDAVFLHDLIRQQWYPTTTAPLASSTRTDAADADAAAADMVRTGLAHPLQREITGIAWSPTDPNVLAVACAQGICLWTLRHAPTGAAAAATDGPLALLGSVDATRPPRLRTWFKPFTGPATALAFSPDGRFLAVGYGFHAERRKARYGDTAAVRLWDRVTGTSTPLDTDGLAHITRDAASGVTHLAWHPAGRYLLSASGAGIVVHDVATATATAIRTSYPVTALTWLHGSPVFFFAMQGVARIMMMQVTMTPATALRDASATTEAPLHAAAWAAPSPAAQAIPAKRTSPVVVSTSAGDEVVLGGTIVHLACDPRGQRLLVVFDGIATPALFAITERPLPDLTLLGLIRGPTWSSAKLAAAYNPPDDIAAATHPTRSLPDTAGGASTTTAAARDARAQAKRRKEPRLPRPQRSVPATAVDGEPLATSVHFAPEYERGALIAIGWQTGKIAFYPCYYPLKAAAAA
ncbi:hypothetical protein CXG81DRAFT_23081 [Caulochytrium protostelioides]|uniref:Uncharacterized protein n=1 Tax=Caulochytrium protostelioides TaxID=1555241 RepID=A0A4P9XFE1_9FUNG|nr:hypothetical protein CXG81DRAFT_23081 [Caulochytrium protostelioides]|eukprot:RKP04305.1 hypothetical protein CXG81DRAFT_23081 [Caulochytrium protostelioides]